MQHLSEPTAGSYCYCFTGKEMGVGVRMAMAQVKVQNGASDANIKNN